MKNAILLLSVAVAIACCAGNTYYVDAEKGSDVSGDGSKENPMQSLVAVMGKVTENNGDIVYAAPGVYSNNTCTVDGFSYRVCIPAGTTLQSTGTRENTIILGEADADAGGNFSTAPYGCGPKAVRCGYLGANSKIVGFTVTGGRDSTVAGSSSVAPGGLLGASKASCFACNCIFSNNVTKCRGAALHQITPVGCYFEMNRAGNNNGDAFQQHDAYNCVFGPTPNYHGYYRCNFYNCTFLPKRGNTYFSRVARTGCKIYNSLILSQSIHWNEANGYYNCLYTELEEGATLDESCKNVTLEEIPYDPVTFMPMPGSLAIDAGNDSYVKPSLDAAHVDYLGNPRVYGKSVDIGAVENQARVTVSDVSGLDLEGLTGVSTAVPVGGIRAKISRNYKTVLKVKGIRINGGELFEFEGDGADRAWEGEFRFGEEVSVEVVYVEKNDWYVDAVNGDDSNDGYTPYRARRTLAAAMALPYLAPGEIVHAAAGVYDEGEVWRKDTVSHFSGSNRVVVAAGVGLVATNADLTVIKGRPHDETTSIGEKSVRCVFLEDGAWIENFTITNGFARGRWNSDGYGGGICSVTGEVGVVGGAAIGCKIVGCTSASYGKLAYGGVLIRCFADDPIGHVNSQLYNIEALVDCVMATGGIHYASAILNSTIHGHVYRSSVYNSYVYYNASRSHFFSSRLWYANAAEESSNDAHTIDEIRKRPAFDANHRPALDDALYCDAGDRNWYDTLFPERWARFKDKDYSGGQRIYNGKIDIGAGEADWRGAYTEALSAKRTAVAEAGPDVTGGVASLNLGAGDAVVLRVDPAKRGFVSVKVVSEGDVSVTCGGEAAEKVGDEYRIFVEAGLSDITVSATANAVVSAVRMPPTGFVMSLR